MRYLDLSNFNTLNVVSIYQMFSYCHSLIYLNLDSFELNYTVNITNSFKGISPDLIICIKDNYTKNYLFGNASISICLEPCSNNNNKKINIFIDGCIKSCLNYKFEYEYKNVCYHECPNDIYPLFDDNEGIINNSKECFEQLPQGYYLDINEKNIKNALKYGKGNETFNNCIECNANFTFYNDSMNIINCYPICHNYYYFDESNTFHCTESLNCPEKFKKLILNKKKCIDECKNDDIYKYEYNNKCYRQCPYNTYVNENNNFFCVFRLINNENITQKIIRTYSGSQIIYECIKDNTLNDNCNFQNIKNETEILNLIKQNLNSLFDSESGKCQIIKGGDNIIYQITNAKNEKKLIQNNFLNNQNLTVLYLGKCEDKRRI